MADPLTMRRHTKNLYLESPKMATTKRLISSFIVSMAALVFTSAAWSQSGTTVNDGDWPDHHGGKFAQRYSPLDQINAENVNELAVAWSFNTGPIGPSAEFNNPSTPIAIDGVLYVTMGNTRNVGAIDAATGQLLWLWRPQEGERFDHAPRKGAGRGLSHPEHYTRLSVGFIRCKDWHS
jgi:glucose dehydrogenase